MRFLVTVANRHGGFNRRRLLLLGLRGVGGGALLSHRLLLERKHLLPRGLGGGGLLLDRRPRDLDGPRHRGQPGHAGPVVLALLELGPRHVAGVEQVLQHVGPVVVLHLPLGDALLGHGLAVGELGRAAVAQVPDLAREELELAHERAQLVVARF
ncbi:hypothetical protein PGQ11_000418 [Apiospora arundinis]